MIRRNKNDGSSVLKIIYKLLGSDGCEYKLVLSGGRMAIIKPDCPEVTLQLSLRGLASFCFMHKLSWLNEDGSTTPCLLPLGQLVAEIEHYDEEAVRIIHVTSGREFVYLLQYRIFIDGDTGQRADDMPSEGVYMDSPIRPEKFTKI